MDGKPLTRSGTDGAGGQVGPGSAGACGGPVDSAASWPYCCVARDRDVAAKPGGPCSFRGQARWFAARERRSLRDTRVWRRRIRLCVVSVVVLVVLASLMVGGDVIQRHLLSDVSTGVRHATLTAQALLLTLVTSTGVYMVMRRQKRALIATAEQLTRVLESYQATPNVPARFENPHLVRCRDVLPCDHRDCPMYEGGHERCWQALALSHASRDDVSPATAIQHCLSCPVYRLSCPDELTELGESFNNLMFLLEAEAGKVGRMRAHLVEKEKMVAIGQIASGIAHEIGNPLSSISSIVQMLKRSKSDSYPRGDGQLDLIETHIQRISMIVRQLGKLAHPGAERWERVDIAQTLDEAVRLISFDRRARGVEVDFERPMFLPPTYGIRGQLQQVFINLLLNALDAMPPGAGDGIVRRLMVRGEVAGSTLLLRMADTGIGIDPAIGRRVFEPFFTTKDPGRGTGLGLAVSYGIVQKHGGSIDFESVVGKGTVFTVRLPVLDAPPET